MTLQEEAGDEITAERIRGLLIPHEYTRLDPLIEVVFTTAEDIKRPAEELPDEGAEIGPEYGSHRRSQQRTETDIIENVRSRIVTQFARKKNKELLKKSKAQFWSSDEEFRICCTVSKYYERTDHYWYAYHPRWDNFLEAGEDAYLLLGCIGLTAAFALPRHFMTEVLDKLHTTEWADSRMYWHLRLARLEMDHFVLRLKGTAQVISIDDYRFDVI